MERMKELCKERNSLYEKQNDLKGQKQQIEKHWNDKRLPENDSNKRSHSPALFTSNL